VVRRQTIEASQGLAPDKPIIVLRRLALAAGQMADPELAHDARQGLALAFGALLSRDPEVAAGQIEGYLRYVQPHLDGVLPAQPALLALDTGALSRLPARTVEVLTAEGISRGLFERTLAYFAGGGRLGDDATAAMLGALVRLPPSEATPAYRELLSWLVERALASGIGARAMVISAVEAGDLAGDLSAANRLCGPLWKLLGPIPADDPDYARALAIGSRLTLSAHAALRSPKDSLRYARLILWAVRLAVRQAAPRNAPPRVAA
jgi:hypothetical protein